LTRSYRNQTADQEQYFAVLDDLNASWEASQQHTLDLRFELKNSLTESEWIALFVDK